MSGDPTPALDTRTGFELGDTLSNALDELAVAAAAGDDKQVQRLKDAIHEIFVSAIALTASTVRKQNGKELH